MIGVSYDLILLFADLSCPTPAAKVYFTVDGSVPDPSATGGSTQLYVNPIQIMGTITVKAIAVAPGFQPSPVVVSRLIGFSPAIA